MKIYLDNFLCSRWNANQRPLCLNGWESRICKFLTWKPIWKIFSAAHCVKGFMWFMIKVTFGEHDRCDDSVRPETRFVLRAISQKFSYSNFDNDMALLRLNDRVPITDHIRPICLPTNKGNCIMFIIVLERDENTLIKRKILWCFLHARASALGI